VAASGVLQPQARAIAIIRDEHRSLATVLHAGMHVLAVARSAGDAPDAVLMRAIVGYLERFRVAQHHPKEEDYLFRRLRARTPSFDAELDELERQHERDRLLVAAIAGRVEALSAAADDEARRRGDPAGGSTPPDLRGLGGDRRRIHQQHGSSISAAFLAHSRSCPVSGRPEPSCC
jgi:hypothetical protein